MPFHGIATLSNDPPYRSHKRSMYQTIDRIEQCKVASLPNLHHRLKIGGRVQPLDDRQHFFRPALIDQVDGSFIVQKWVFRMEP